MADPVTAAPEADGSATREAVWLQLIQDPERDVDTMVLVCAEYGYDVSREYVRTTRAHWRNTVQVLKAHGCRVPA